jgi:hypothetical protein
VLCPQLDEARTGVLPVARLAAEAVGRNDQHALNVGLGQTWFYGRSAQGPHLVTRDRKRRRI